MARISMRSNRKFMRLCRDIQRPPYQVRGLLEMMWESAHENEPTFPTLDDAEVVSTWDGEAGVFGKALLACGFLDAVEGGFFVHDYWQHAPGWVREREKKRRQRDASGTDRGRTGDKVGTELGQDGDVSSHGAPSVAKPSVAKPSVAKPSEEAEDAAGQPRIKKPTDPLLGEKKKWAVDEWNKVAEDRGWSRVSKSDPDPDQDHNITTQASRKLPENPGSSRKVREYEYSPEFLEFMSLYPNKDAKRDAFKAFEQVNAYSHMEAIRAALSWQVVQEKWTKDGGKYVPLPATYLRGRRWEDERTAIQPAPKKPKVDPSDPQYAEIMELLK